MDMLLVVGLGNPGPTYASHRHNVGYLVVDELARRLDTRFSVSRGMRAEVAEGRLGPLGPDAARIALVKPRTFMNESGGPVAKLLAYYKLTPDRVIAVHDELDINPGQLRVKYGGGDNGHNGLKSLTRSLGSRDYLRVRFGIGRPPGRQDPADYVLRDFAPAERKELPFLLDRAADSVEALLTGPLEAAQNTFHAS